ncbi:MAG: undecaprenyl/decaprenyl-phosphate alpha-N-acetylglucosaminyl 1-phosphate transferase [Balneolales bacterium]|nr:undecaprenyl/decaprenyl-phosphate alpha-N-acetylglucosaminyl 1-phosphate transferase [Balneolales bacterium]
MDLPDNGRKQHKAPTPTLGGVGIFFGFVLSISIVGGFMAPDYFPFLIAGITLLFVVGIKDDLMGVSAKKKLVAQILASVMVVYGGGIYIPELGGLFGINSIPAHLSQPFSVFAMVIILNAYNLIDGVDGLAGSVGFIASATLGTFLFLNGAVNEAILAFALAGALGGFLIYNFEPTRIFMGDTGSMVVGFLLAMLAFNVMQTNLTAEVVYLPASAVMVFGVLIIPMYDTLRVILIRLKNRQSPLNPDANHMHHVLMKSGYSHRGIVLVMATASIIIITTAFILREVNVHLLFGVMAAQAMLILPVARTLMHIIRGREEEAYMRQIRLMTQARDAQQKTLNHQENGDPTSKKHPATYNLFE